MKKKEVVDLVVAGMLIVLGSLLLVFPLLNITNVKYIFMGVLTFYGVMNLAQFLSTSNEKDYEGLCTMIASIICLVILGFLNIDNNPKNLALVMLMWIIIMSLIKLKKCDYYHDRQKRIYILKLITLVLFILSGLLTVINLYYDAKVQVLVLGYFYFIHGILELVDPVTNYLVRIGNKK